MLLVSDIKRSHTYRNSDTGLDEVWKDVCDAFKFRSAGKELDRVYVIIRIQRAVVILETINVLEIIEPILGRGSENIERMGTSSGFVDEGAFDMGAEDRGTGLS